MAANSLTASLIDLGFSIRRFKTGTPARVDGRTIDFSKMEPQYGDDPIVPFSFMTDPAALKNRALCYLTYTTPETHAIILDNLDRAPMYSRARFTAPGARYCPSIEDKVVRFKDKERHPIFMEPEGLNTCEMVRAGHVHRPCREDVQRRIYAHRSRAGARGDCCALAYAIEYDCIDPHDAERLRSACKHIQGLYYRRARSTAPPAMRRPPRRDCTPA